MNSVVKRVIFVVVLLNARAIISAERQAMQSDHFKGVKYQPAPSESFRFVSQSASHDVQESTVELSTVVKDPAQDLVLEGLLPHWHTLQDPMLEGRYVTPAAFLAAGIENELERVFHRHDNEMVALDRQYKRDITSAKRSRCAGRCAVLLSIGGLFATGNFGAIHAINAIHKNKCG